uniref:Uncharacterized protein n=1 Tax=Arundo donax TaxID=35708 RepID=A0A0A9GRS4_ARUDO
MWTPLGHGAHMILVWHSR